MRNDGLGGLLGQGHCGDERGSRIWIFLELHRRPRTRPILRILNDGNALKGWRGRFRQGMLLVVGGRRTSSSLRKLLAEVPEHYIALMHCRTRVRCDLSSRRVDNILWQLTWRTNGLDNNESSEILRNGYITSSEFALWHLRVPRSAVGRMA